jgi:hypothetical protein
MKMIWLALILLVGIRTTDQAWGQMPAPTSPGPTPSAYCSSGAGAFTLSQEQGFAETRQKCKPGDTILLPGGSTGAIARICDFSRSIVSTDGLVICTVTSQRSSR